MIVLARRPLVAKLALPSQSPSIKAPVKAPCILVSSSHEDAEPRLLGTSIRRAFSPRAPRRSVSDLRSPANAWLTRLSGQIVPATQSRDTYSAVPHRQQRKQPLALSSSQVRQYASIDEDVERPEHASLQRTPQLLLHARGSNFS